ncbi:hypothetical protein [Streptomyces sp. NPDC040750]|uniref:hypothetical protein n=1 Tax=Streptomyces sp. NPDC040750 TaxID=3154491 RepID=UPI00340401CB
MCHRELGFTRQALVALSNRPSGEDYWNFDGRDGGHHQLYLRINQNPRTDDPRVMVSPHEGVSDWGQGLQIGTGTTAASPAVATFDGKLYCVVRGHAHENLCYSSSSDGHTWGQWAQLPPGTVSRAPALAAYDGKLYCVSGNVSALFYASFDGRTWSQWAPLPPGTAHHTPALAAYGGKLYCAMLSLISSELFYASFRRPHLEQQMDQASPGN